MSSWCSWLSRLSNTQTVSSSNLDEDSAFLFLFGELPRLALNHVTCIWQNKTQKRADPGIEPGTSHTRSANHTTRPISLYLILSLAWIHGISFHAH